MSAYPNISVSEFPTDHHLCNASWRQRSYLLIFRILNVRDLGLGSQEGVAVGSNAVAKPFVACKTLDNLNFANDDDTCPLDCFAQLLPALILTEPKVLFAHLHGGIYRRKLLVGHEIVIPFGVFTVAIGNNLDLQIA
jgi:hypothetical protein